MYHQSQEYIEESVDLARLWRALCAGRLSMIDSYCNGGRCFAVLKRGAGMPARASRVRILERVLAGESQQSVAIDIGVSSATMAGYCLQVLSGFVPRHWVSRAPIVLTMAAAAAQGAWLGRARCEAIQDDGSWVISVEVPGLTFRDRLSHGEWDVARRAIEGESHSEMALARGTTRRTVANQIAAVFAKLKVSGRAELRAKAVQELAAQPQTLPTLARESTLMLDEAGSRRMVPPSPPLLDAVSA